MHAQTMRTPQAVLFIIVLLATIGGMFTLFLPDSPTQGPSAGLAAQLQPIADDYRARERDAAAGHFATAAEMAALEARLHAADGFAPLFVSEQSGTANARAKSAVAAYGQFVADIEAAKSRPVDGRSVARNARLSNRIEQALAIGAGSGLTRLKAVLVPLAFFILLPATLLVAFVPALVRVVRAAGLRRSGTLMHGVVVASSPTGMMTNYVPEHRATIRLDGGATSTATMLGYSGLPIGSEVTVKANPRDPRTAVIVNSG